ncbi:MAG TPA: molybdate ABC transporter substrate-binding protein [Deltaproteobacteria bacterium]|nr:molybdate ABC transporter substrate-binding protein [Deltaproteobacteria bacterium]
MRRFITTISIILFIITGFSASAFAGEKLLVAVAANFILPSEELTKIFQDRTGIVTEVTYTSTGKLYGQIVNGAPYDVFLSADEKRPDLLEKQGLSDKPFVYATGQVVVWTAEQTLCGATDWQSVVKNPRVLKIAIANTESAPYGTASMIALQRVGLWNALSEKYVFPQTIAQAFQYAETKSADVGFCAYSSALSDKGKKGCFYTVPEAPTIVQSACILKRTENRSAAEKYVEFIRSHEAQKIKEKYGYR